MSTLIFKDLGATGYRAALAIQESLVERKEDLPDILLFVEHPHVITIGRGGKESNIVDPGEVPVYRTNRGGDATYHGPGQMVVYPILDLKSRLRRDVHRYLRYLEKATIRTLKSFDIEAERNPPWTGVWIGKKKIASIGVAVRRGITYHGLALNVNTDLSYFERIVSCGLPWAEVTSMARELGKEQNIERVKERFVDHFADLFGYSGIKQTINLLNFQAQKGSSYETREDPRGEAYFSSTLTRSGPSGTT
ncbi:MAG: lipoyl(octanoyl) transferase LipB [Deltaproteobacteria bacterium]|nr:MAG: lipoyl(octanoyl) transferase LipB [Deltaproteobacteria bacterium]